MDNSTMYKFNTGKGRSYASRKKVNGEIISTWLAEAGGVNQVISECIRMIKNAGTYITISKHYNISPVTARKFIYRHLDKELIDLELKTRTTYSHINRSRGLKGKVNPNKGKTYLEIYGTTSPGCGFKKGDANPNFTRDKYIGRLITNKRGERFRSTYEVTFSEILIDNNIPYMYEHHFKLNNGKVKIVDFIVNNTLIEVTGYAYLAWQEDFDAKIALLHMSYPDNPIIIVCDDTKRDLLIQKHGDYCTVVSITDTCGIISILSKLMR